MEVQQKMTIFGAPPKRKTLHVPEGDMHGVVKLLFSPTISLKRIILSFRRTLWCTDEKKTPNGKVLFWQFGPL